MQKRSLCRFASGLPLLLMIALVDCGAPAGRYPSLSPRPIETLPLAEPTRPTPPAATIDSAAYARLEPTIDSARVIDRAFHKSLQEARPALMAGRGAPNGSDAWIEAQEALSRIETARDPIRRSLSQLDTVRNASPTETDTGEALAAAKAYDDVKAILAAEDAEIQALWPSSR